MASLRDFLGSKCPQCRTDILQQAPSQNRMPTDHAWCPSCQTLMSVEDLSTKSPKAGSWLKRLLGRPQRG